jgi:hypothetical protein
MEENKEQPGTARPVFAVYRLLFRRLFVIWCL